MRAGLIRFSVLLFLLGAAVNARAYAKEYILVSGGPSLIAWEKFKAQPHDRWWGNFVRTARVRMQEILARDPGAQITWFVYREGYVKRGRQEGVDLLANIYSVRDKYGVKLVLFDRTEELINYLNAGQPRDTVKIVNFEYFGHSNKACFLFDYSSEIDSASKCWLHENDLTKIKRGIFSKDAFVKSWGCHTAESMSKKFRAATGIKMWGAIGKTDYSEGYVIKLSKEKDRWAY
jgi:hypothetical protein